MKFTAKIFILVFLSIASSSVTIALFIFALTQRTGFSETSFKIAAIAALVSIFINFIILISVLSFLRPIAKLVGSLKEIAVGQFFKRVDIRSKDEVGELGSTINLLIDKLEQLYIGMQQKFKTESQIIDQKFAELEQDKAKDEAILNSMIDGMIVTDPSGNITLINVLARQLLGIRNPNLYGHSIYYLTQFYDEMDKIVERKDFPLFISLNYGQKWTKDLTIHQVDGKKRVINMTSTAIRRNDKRVGGIAILRDITKEKEIDRMKTEFISLASHQLRTPLSAIKWFSEMLLNGDAGQLSQEQAEFTKNISDSTERMVQLVNSLLNISRIESGRIIIDPKPTDLKTLISGIINDLKGKTKEKQQSLIISVHGDLPMINLDPRLIGQVYLNLLTNAIKYTPKGGEIHVFVSKKDNQVISQVSDTGFGIPKDAQNKIFQKFFRADNVVKIETDGTGLGLYLVRAIIESSGGQIWFKSEENKGTTFWFSLPLSGMEPKAGEVTLDI